MAHDLVGANFELPQIMQVSGLKSPAIGGEVD
jgi:hypothetical protein